jgi:hypothetical protein
MMFEQPPRFKHDPELGPILRAADHVQVSADRLARNAACVKASASLGMMTAWKVLGVLGVIAIGVPIAARVWQVTPQPSSTMVVSLPVAVDSDILAAPDSNVAMQAAVDEPSPSFSVDRPRASTHVVSPAVGSSRELVATPIEDPQVLPPDRVSSGGSEPAPVEQSQDAAPPAVSDLPQQIALYESARDTANRGEYSRCVELLDLLLQMFPATPLRADAELTRAEALARANRVDEAVRALELLVDDAAHRGRHGELLRMLGDLYRRRGDCSHALDAYDRALSEPLRERDRVSTIRGRELCR